MLTGVILALGLCGRLSAAHTFLLAVTWSSPEVAVGPLAVALGLVLRDKGRSTRSALMAGWLRTAAGELRAGSSLRSAIAGAVDAYPDLGLERIGRLAYAGRPLSEMSAALAECQGMEAIAAVVAVAGSTGGVGSQRARDPGDGSGGRSDAAAREAILDGGRSFKRRIERLQR